VGWVQKLEGEQNRGLTQIRIDLLIELRKIYMKYFFVFLLFFIGSYYELNLDQSIDLECPGISSLDVAPEFATLVSSKQSSPSLKHAPSLNFLSLLGSAGPRSKKLIAVQFLILGIFNFDSSGASLVSDLSQRPG
jgi:hypothetical protein